MEWIKPGTKIDFMGKKEWALLGSGLLIMVGLLSILLKGGLNYGIDFTGGTLVQLRFERPIPLEEMRGGLKTIGLGNSLLQQFGDPREVLIRFGSSSRALKDPGKEIAQALRNLFPGGKIEVRRVEAVGPQASRELLRKALIAVLVSFVAMFLYVAFRFGVPYAAGGILALIHDVTITVGFFSLTGKEISLPVVAALLTIIGYSINDTIVVFDRIREKLRKQPKGDLSQTINLSINETLSRTILTSFTVFIVLLSLFFLGGEVIHDFAFALLVGVVVGSYSSIAIASPVLIYWPKFSPAKASNASVRAVSPQGSPNPLPNAKEKKRKGL